MVLLHRRSTSTSTTTTTTTQTQPQPSTQPTTPTPRKSPLHSLPTELYHQIASHLPPQSAASLSLSTRTALHALGTQHLHTALSTTPTVFARRALLAHTIERAFPSSWFCAWCSGFHAWRPADGPTGDAPLTGDPDAQSARAKCTAYNGALEFTGYVVRFHHVRLAVAYARLGDGYGIPIQAFEDSRSDTVDVFRVPVRAKTTQVARVVAGSFLLHSTATLLLPAWMVRNKGVLDAVWGVLPRGMVVHRGGEPHDGMLAVLDNVLRRGWKYPFAQACGGCRSDFAVSCYEFKGGYVLLRVRTWRDLGSGESPFEVGWRAHCGGRGRSERCGVEEGEVRRAFERGESETSEVVDGVADDDSALKGVFLALKRRRLSGLAREEVRRSRAVSWRTAEENEEANRREEERRWEAARAAAEHAIRLEAELAQ